MRMAFHIYTVSQHITRSRAGYFIRAATGLSKEIT